MSLFTADILRNRDVIASLWRALRLPPVPAKLRYSDYHPYRFVVDDDVSAPFALFERGGSLMFGTRTQPRRFEGWIRRHPLGLGDVWFYLNLESWDPRWLDWVLAILGDVPVLYGFACSKEEHDSKHRVVTEYMVGRSTGWVGTGIGDLKRGLPGMYWLNVFGAALSAELDLGSVRAVDGAILRELPGGQTAILAGEDPIRAPLAMVELERAISAAIGEDYFFDRLRPDRTLRTVKAFSDQITRLSHMD